MNLLNSSNDLVKKPASLWLGHTLALNDEIKELAPTCILHNQVQLPLCLNDFEQLNNVRVPDQFQKLNLSGNSLYVSNLVDAILFEELDGNALASEDVTPKLHLPKRSFTYGFAQYVVA